MGGVPLKQGLPAAAVAIALGWIAWLWLAPDQAFFLLFDDSFYYLEIARHIVAGQGSTFDGIHPTNGYHPLWMAVCTAVMALGADTDTAPRLLLTGQLLAWAGVLVALLRRARGLLPGLAVVLLGTHPFLRKAVANGMESTAVVVAWAGVLLLASGRDLLAPDAGRERG
ncbi:MAG: hypothetical protein KC656_37550, partial [Myxococcales bacterium]|nr:hypothetical protein [Myxococcales bacterium]